MTFYHYFKMYTLLVAFLVDAKLHFFAQYRAMTIKLCLSV